MARTVPAAFDVFHSLLTTSDQETAAAQSHRASVKDCLTRNFGMTNFFRTGSFGNGTNIRYYSDTDYFASIPRDRLKSDSGNTLREMKDVLCARFPNTSIYVDSPAVVLPFGTDASETFEVIPAGYVTLTTQNNTIYEIPDRQGGWMRSSPSTHNAYVADIHVRLDRKVKPLIRFIKAWKYYKSVPISSFFLEMYVARYAHTQASIVYIIDLHSVFQSLWQSQLYGISDPSGISITITACSTEAKRLDALQKLETACVRVNEAYNAYIKNDPAEAIRILNLLYNGNFPSYG
jgi:hypothetical protein